MLRDLIRSKERGGYVIPLLEKATLLAGKQDMYTRDRHYFHPSMISGDFCPRAWLLGQRDKTLYLSVQVGVQTQWRFDVGSSLHRLVQERLSMTGSLFGKWECRRWCLEERCTWYGFKPKAGFCPLGVENKVKWDFCEVVVLDEELNIYGTADGIVLLDSGKFVIEFKTANSRTFSSMTEPMDEHKEQVSWYVDVLTRNSWQIEQVLVDMQQKGFVVDNELNVVRQPFKGAVLVYMNKDSQEFREFVVKTDVPLVLPEKVRIRGIESFEDRGVLEEKKEVLRQTLKWMKEGVIPDRLYVCTSKGCARAKNCFASTVCF